MSRFVLPSCIVLALTALVGCSFEGGLVARDEPSGTDGSVSFRLLVSSNFQLDSVSYDVSTELGADVDSGAIALLDDPSAHVPVLTVQSLSSGDYGLTLSAWGRLGDGTSVPCTSVRTGFHISGGSDTFIGDISLSCTANTQVDTGSSKQVDTASNPTTHVVLDTVASTEGNLVETFSYGPRIVQGENVGNTCWFSSIALNIDHTNEAIQYSWTVMPDGTLTLNSSNTSGTYRCSSAGDKTLTITAMLNGESSMKSVTVSCTPCPQ